MLNYVPQQSGSDDPDRDADSLPVRNNARSAWQIVPPIVSGARFPTVNPILVAPLEEEEAGYPVRFQPAPSPETQVPSHPSVQEQEATRQAPSTAWSEADKNFLLQIVQPGLTGLMDGSVSTLAPIFAVAFATHLPFTVFLVGMASALGAG